MKFDTSLNLYCRTLFKQKQQYLLQGQHGRYRLGWDVGFFEGGFFWVQCWHARSGHEQTLQFEKVTSSKEKKFLQGESHYKVFHIENCSKSCLISPYSINFKPTKVRMVLTSAM